MMKKIFSKLFIATALFAAVGSFSSCKDYNDEIIVENNYNDEELRKQIDNLKTQHEKDLANAKVKYDSLKTAFEEHKEYAEKTYATKAELEAAKAELEKKYKEADEELRKGLQTQIDAITVQITNINTYIETVKKELENKINAIAQCKCDMAKIEKAIEDLATLSTKVEALELNLQNNYATKADLNALKEIVNGLVSCNCPDLLGRISEIEGKLPTFATLADLAALHAQVDADSIRIDALEKAFEDAKNSVKCDSIAAALDSISKAHDAEISVIKDSLVILGDSIAKTLTLANTYTDNAINALKNELAPELLKLNDLLARVNIAEEEIDTLQSKVAALETAVAANTEKINDLMGRVENLEDALEKRISSVNIQGAYSPVVGYFNIPMGIKSNIVASYFGTFGTGVSEMNFPFAYSESMYNKKENPLQALKASLGYAGETIDELNDGKAGKIYMTVNPTEVDLTDVEFSLINSLGEKAPVSLEVKPSEDKLMFGYTRAGGATLYEAIATITDTEAAEYSLNASDYKEIFRDLKDGEGINLSAIPEALYNTFNSIADANAVSATWTDKMGEHTVLSNYDIAAISVQPLGYTFMQDYEFGSMPGYERISNAIDNVINKIQFDLSIGNFEDIEVNLNKLSLDKDKFIISIDTTITVDGQNVTIYEKGGYTGLYIEMGGSEYPIKASDDVVVSVDGQAVNFTYTNTDFVGEILKIEDMVNTQIDQLQDLIDDVNSMLSQLRDTNDKINQSIADAKDQIKSELHKYLDKFNNKFTTALNSINDKLQPAMFLKTTDGFCALSQVKSMPSEIENGAVLVPSSYTAELLAPAFKKYVAITAVDGSTDNLAAANTGDLNKVLDGDVRAIEFNGESGKTYEVTYAALDYAGFVSIVKYYVTVK